MSSYRHLTAAAHNVLHAMASGLAHDGAGYFAEHLGWAAARAQVPEIRLDLIAGTVWPPEAATPALERYAQWGRDWWPETVARLGAEPARVRGVVVRAMFDLARRAAAGDRLMADGDRLTADGAHVVELTATITDDRGVAHEGAPPRSELYVTP